MPFPYVQVAMKRALQAPFSCRMSSTFSVPSSWNEMEPICMPMVGTFFELSGAARSSAASPDFVVATAAPAPARNERRVMSVIMISPFLRLEEDFGCGLQDAVGRERRCDG